MLRKQFLVVAVATQCVLLVLVLKLESASASSYNDLGITGSFSAPDYSSGTCEIFTGPRQISVSTSLADNEFLLKIQNGNGTELSLQGTFRSKHNGQLELFPNRGVTQTTFTDTLQEVVVTNFEFQPLP